MRQPAHLDGGAGRTVVAAVLYALDHHLGRLAEDHARAKRLAAGLAELQGVNLDPASVETNIVLAGVTPGGMSPQAIVDHAAEQGVLIGSFGPSQIRAVTHLDVDDAGIERALTVLRGILHTRAAA